MLNCTLPTLNLMSQTDSLVHLSVMVPQKALLTNACSVLWNTLGACDFSTLSWVGCRWRFFWFSWICTWLLIVLLSSPCVWFSYFCFVLLVSALTAVWAKGDGFLWGFASLQIRAALYQHILIKKLLKVYTDGSSGFLWKHIKGTVVVLCVNRLLYVLFKNLNYIYRCIQASM